MSRKQQFTGKHVTILEHIIIRGQFIWLMSNEDNFIINQLSDMILKLHSYRNDIIQN